jgi:CBS-domain-containing membrane protein
VLNKFKGDNATLPPKADSKSILLAGLGAAIAISSVALIADLSNSVLILGSFGASCVLLFGFPDSPFSQPRNVVGGHFLSALSGMLALKFLGHSWWSLAIGLACAVMGMMVTRTVHPPAGSNPVIVYLSQPAWNFLAFPVFLGSLILVLVALIYLNIIREAKYPKYW